MHGKNILEVVIIVPLMQVNSFLGVINSVLWMQGNIS
jgi:hypothetical protein